MTPRIKVISTFSYMGQEVEDIRCLTTLVASLAAGFAARKQRTLLVDFDNRGFVPYVLGVSYDVPGPSMATVFFEEVPIRDAVQHMALPGLDVVIGSQDPGDLRALFQQFTSRSTLLQELLQDVVDDYDSVLIHCPAVPSPLTFNALLAADALIFCLTPGSFSFKNARYFDRIIRANQRRAGRLAPILSLLVPDVPPTPENPDHALQQMRAFFGEKVLSIAMDAPQFQPENASADPATHAHFVETILDRIKSYESLARKKEARKPSE